MRIFESFIDAASIRALESVVGSEWAYITGAVLSEKPGYLFAWDAVAIRTSKKTIAICSTEVDSDFEGALLDYDVLSAKFDDTVSREALARGDVSAKFAGATVEKIWILREKIVKRNLGEMEWCYSTDFAVLIELSAGSVGVFKGSHVGSQALQVTFAATVDALEISDSSDEWTFDSEIGVDYVVTREVLALSDLEV